MNIIIEGPDGVGKSTLVKKLKEYYNIDSIRLSYKDPKDLNFYSRLLEKTDCIFDRQFLSEIVYSPIFGRVCQLTEEDVTLLYNKTKKLNIPIFILELPTDELLDRINKRGKEHINIINNLQKICDSFKDLSIKFNIEVINTSKISFEEIIKKVEKYNEEYKNSLLK